MLKSEGFTLLLDRDGILNENIGYLSNVSQIIPTALGKALSRTVDQYDLNIAVISNQPVVATGGATFSEVVVLTREVLRQCGFSNYLEVSLYLCPHLPIERRQNHNSQFFRDCSCRKPRPGLIFRALTEMGLSASNSLFIGDSEVDIEAGVSAGVKTLHVHLENFPPCPNRPNVRCLGISPLTETLNKDSINAILDLFRGENIDS